MVEALVRKIERNLGHLCSSIESDESSAVTDSSSDPKLEDVSSAMGHLLALKSLAREFGALQCFEAFQGTYIALLDASTHHAHYQPLRLKAVHPLSNKQLPAHVTVLN